MEKEKKVYEVPETMVHSINFNPIMQTSSPGGEGGTGTPEEGSRRIWIDDEDEE